MTRLKRVPQEKRVFVDESGINTFLHREKGRAPRGEQVQDTIPGKKFERMNVIGALCNGEYHGVMCYRHTTSSGFFEGWFANVLLKAIPHGKGYTVILDNAAFHSKERLRALARGKVRLLFLPPYSPDYNPIEKSWANMKRFLRGGMKHFQSVKDAVYGYFGVKAS